MKKNTKNIKNNYKEANLLEEENLQKNDKNPVILENNLNKLKNNSYIGKVSAFDEYVFFNLRYSKFLELTNRLSNQTFLLIERENQFLLSQILSQKDLSIYEDENKIKAIITHNEDITSTERDIYTSREYKLKILGSIINNEFTKEINFYPTRLDNILFFDNFDIILDYFNKKVLKNSSIYSKIKIGKLKNGHTKTNSDLEIYFNGFILLLNIEPKFIINLFSTLNKSFLIFTTNRDFALKISNYNKTKLIDLNSLNLNTLNKNEQFEFFNHKSFNLVFLYDTIFNFDSVNIIKLLLEQFIKIDSEFGLYLDDDINYFEDKFLAKNIFFRQFINRLNNKLFIYKTTSLDKFSINLLTKVNYIISKDISLNDVEKISNSFSLINSYSCIGYEINNGELVLRFDLD